MYNNLYNTILPNPTHRPGNLDQQSHPGHPRALALFVLLFSILHHLRQLHLSL